MKCSCAHAQRGGGEEEEEEESIQSKRDESATVDAAHDREVLDNHRLVEYIECVLYIFPTLYRMCPLFTFFG